jgi:hypothetical protein
MVWPPFGFEPPNKPGKLDPTQTTRVNQLSSKHCIVDVDLDSTSHTVFFRCHLMGLKVVVRLAGWSIHPLRDWMPMAEASCVQLLVPRGDEGC